MELNLFNKEEREELDKKKDFMEFILDMMVQAGDINAIVTKKLSEVTMLSAEIHHDDTIMKNEDNAKEFLSLLEQFESLLKDFADEKNIEIEEE